MHTALVQRLIRDRSAWELTHGYDELPEAAEIATRILPTAMPAHA